MAKKVSSPKKTKKDHSTGKSVATGRMSSVLPSGARMATVPQGMPGRFHLRTTHASIQALPQNDRFVPTVVLAGNEPN
jgi:hypothetical protein